MDPMSEADDIIQRRSDIMAGAHIELGRRPVSEAGPVLPQPRSTCPTCGSPRVGHVNHPLWRDEARRRGAIAARHWACVAGNGCPPFVWVDGVGFRVPEELGKVTPRAVSGSSTRR